METETAWTLMQRSTDKRKDSAKSHGFTGDMCNECGSFSMRRTGACLTCQECGSNTGCG